MDLVKLKWCKWTSVEVEVVDVGFSVFPCFSMIVV